MKTFNRWCLEPEDLKELDAVKARDLIIECFFDAQKETLARAKKTLGQGAETDEMKRATVSIIKVTFKELGADWNRPTKETLGKVVESLAKKSQMWGTPPDIIEHHREQLGRLFRVLDQR